MTDKPVHPAVIGTIRVIEASARIICAATLFVLFAGLLANVVLRYFAGSGLNWAYDMHAILLPWLIAGGVVLATVHNRNIAITIAMNLTRGQAHRVLAMLVCALTAAVSSTVVVASLPVLEAARHQTFTALWGISAFWGYASLVYAFGGIAIVSILDLGVLLTRGISRTGEAASSLS